MNYKNKSLEIFKKEIESSFDDYRDKEVKKMEKYIKEELTKIPSHHTSKQLSLGDLLWEFDDISLYPSAMWDEKSIYLKIETVYAFTEDIND